MELLQSCTKPLIYSWTKPYFHKRIELRIAVFITLCKPQIIVVRKHAYLDIINSSQAFVISAAIPHLDISNLSLRQMVLVHIWVLAAHESYEMKLIIYSIISDTDHSMKWNLIVYGLFNHSSKIRGTSEVHLVDKFRWLVCCQLFK